MNSSFQEAFEGLNEKTYKKTAGISLKMANDEWFIKEFGDDSDLLDAISGGLVSMMSQWENSLGDTQESDSSGASGNFGEFDSSGESGFSANTDVTQGAGEGATEEGMVYDVNDGIISFSTDDFSVKYNRHEVSKDYDGNPVLLYYYDFTNLSEETLSPSSSVLFTAYQNGIECDLGFLMDAPDEYGNSLKSIQPGATIKSCSAFTITDRSDVTMEGKEYMSFSGDKDVQVLSLE